MNWRFLIWPGLCLLTWSVFWQTRQFEFFGIDDEIYVTNNSHVTGGLTKENVAWAFTPSWHAANWHPLTWLSLMLDAELCGTNAGAFHLTNVALHTLNVLLLYAMLWQWTGAAGRAAFVAALFAVHPLHVESVAWISERKDVLSTLFGLLAFMAYGRFVRTANWKWYAAMASLLACSLLAKQMLVTFPFLLLLLDYWPLNRIDTNAARSDWGRLVLEKVPLLVLVAVFCIAALVAQYYGKAVKGLIVYTVPLRIENALLSYALYLKMTFWPVGLGMYYPHPAGNISITAVIAAALLIAALTFVAVKQWKRHPWFGVGWFWYLGTLVPVIGLVQIGDQQLADRYMYVPLVGILIAIAWGAPQVFRGEFVQRFVVPGAAALVVLACTVTAWKQTSYWQNDFTLLEHTLAVTSDNYFIRDNLGAALHNKGQLAEAAAQFETSLRIWPDGSGARRNLGITYYKQGRLDEAAIQLDKAIALDPDDGLAHYFRGRIAKAAGDWERAERHQLRAVQLRPEDASAHFELGVAYDKRGALLRAEEHLRRSIALDPTVAGSYNYLGVVQIGLGKRDAAIANFKKALELAPGWEPAQENLRLALEQRP